MKEWLLPCLLVGFMLIAGGAWAQTTGDWEVETTGPNGDIEFSNGIARATGGVLIKYRTGHPDAAELTSNEATLTQATGEVTAVGNVILRRDGLTWRAERIDYNFKTKRVKSTQFRSGNSQIYFSGEQVDGNTTAGFYTARNVTFTTDDIHNPDFYIKAKKSTSCQAR